MQKIIHREWYIPAFFCDTVLIVRVFNIAGNKLKIITVYVNLAVAKNKSVRNKPTDWLSISDCGHTFSINRIGNVFFNFRLACKDNLLPT